ncbi:MAG TPA: sugar phosphate isomerase/epimerase, partial [Anaerolineae bacterium]
LNETHKLTLCLDASHVALVGEDPVAHLRKYRDRIGYIHLKDWTHGAFTEMGRGSIGIDFPAILHELETMNFTHWVVIEQSRSDVSPLRSAQVNAEYLRSIGYSM